MRRVVLAYVFADFFIVWLKTRHLDSLVSFAFNLLLHTSCNLCRTLQNIHERIKVEKPTS